MTYRFLIEFRTRPDLEVNYDYALTPDEVGYRVAAWFRLGATSVTVRVAPQPGTASWTE